MKSFRLKGILTEKKSGNIGAGSVFASGRFFARVCALFIAAASFFTVLSGALTLPSNAEGPIDDTQENYLAYMVAEQDSGQILYVQNAQAACDASLASKLMCAVVVSEYTVDGKKILVTDSVTPTENSISSDGKFRLYAGTGYTVGNLLRAMLLGGADNCARALASFVNPNAEYFVTLMNQTAAKLELKDTYFTSPDGAKNSLARTTVTDMARLYDYALKNSTVRNIIQSEFSHIWNNTAIFNLCSLPFALKNTYGTATAGGLFQSGGNEGLPGTIAVNITLPQSASGDAPMKLLVIVQDSVDDEQLNTLARSLIADSFVEFHKARAFKAGDKVASYSISGQSLSIVSESDVYLVLPADAQVSAYVQSVTYTFTDEDPKNAASPPELSLPVTEGQKLGTATLLLRDGSVHVIRILAGNTIQTDNPRFNSFLNIVETYKPLFIFIAILLAVEIFIVIVVAVNRIRRFTEKKRLLEKRSGRRDKA